MSEYRGAVIQEASRILDYILKEKLSEEEKDRVIHDSIENFNEHVNPGWLKYAFFCNGGAEANEMALKLARLASGKHYFISTVNGFHGKSLGAVSVTGKGDYRKPYLPMIQGVQHVEFGNADAAETAIKNLIAVGETVAAMIVEPIQGEAGIVLPPHDYLQKLRAICDKYEVFLILDEIQTGMGRTGTLWACEDFGVVPDILTFGKAFGGGVMPITGIIARPHLWIEELQDNPWILGSPTFGGNPLALNNARVNRMEPPGIIRYETIDTVIDRLDETLAEVAAIND